MRTIRLFGRTSVHGSKKRESVHEKQSEEAPVIRVTGKKYKVKNADARR